MFSYIMSALAIGGWSKVFITAVVSAGKIPMVRDLPGEGDGEEPLENLAW